jgi:hypothetical protein
MVERHFATGFYGWLQPWVTALSNQVPWALLDVQVMAATAAALVILARATRRRPRARPSLGRRWLGRLRTAAAVAATAYLVFLVMWGLNYRRAPVEHRVAFDGSRVTSARVAALAVEATRALNALHAPANAVPWPAWRDLPGSFGPELSRVARRLRLGWEPRPGRPKPTLLGPYFRWAAIAGMTNPFALEVLPSPDTLPFERHAVVAHEWAHLAGFAHEAEASFVAWLMCQGADRQARYSGWFSVWPSLVAALPVRQRADLAAQLGDGPRRDLAAVAARNARAVPALRSAAWRGYDAYLRAQHVEAGVASYEGVVRLLAGLDPRAVR